MAINEPKSDPRADQIQMLCNQVICILYVRHDACVTQHKQHETPAVLLMFTDFFYLDWLINCFSRKKVKYVDLYREAPLNALPLLVSQR